MGTVGAKRGARQKQVGPAVVMAALVAVGAAVLLAYRRAMDAPQRGAAMTGSPENQRGFGAVGTKLMVVRGSSTQGAFSIDGGQSMYGGGSIHVLIDLADNSNDPGAESAVKLIRAMFRQHTAMTSQLSRLFVATITPLDQTGAGVVKPIEVGVSPELAPISTVAVHYPGPSVTPSQTLMTASIAVDVMAPMPPGTHYFALSITERHHPSIRAGWAFQFPGTVVRRVPADSPICDHVDVGPIRVSATAVELPPYGSLNAMPASPIKMALAPPWQQDGFPRVDCLVRLKGVSAQDEWMFMPTQVRTQFEPADAGSAMGWSSTFAERTKSQAVVTVVGCGETFPGEQKLVSVEGDIDGRRLAEDTVKLSGAYLSFDAATGHCVVDWRHQQTATAAHGQRLVVLNARRPLTASIGAPDYATADMVFAVRMGRSANPIYGGASQGTSVSLNPSPLLDLEGGAPSLSIGGGGGFAGPASMPAGAGPLGAQSGIGVWRRPGAKTPVSTKPGVTLQWSSSTAGWSDVIFPGTSSPEGMGYQFYRQQMKPLADTGYVTVEYTLVVHHPRLIKQPIPLGSVTLHFDETRSIEHRHISLMLPVSKRLDPSWFQ